MALAFKWLTRILLLMVVLGLGAFGLAWLVTSGSLPDYDGKYRVSGIDQPVEIVRDIHAVPHILGKTDRDTYFGLGFVHAQDRLWQMEMSRRTAQGTLSELFGERTLRTDRLMRALDIYGISVRAVRHQSPETLAALEAYSAGVNAWISQVGRDALGRGAPEFLLFTQQIAPWTPADSIAVAKLMALNLTAQAAKETRRAALSLALPPERLRDILPDYPDQAVVGMPEFSQMFPQMKAPVLHAAAAPDLSPLNAPGFAGASNAFAANGSRTATGQPLLATDPHLALSAPGVWMLVRMKFPGTDVIGASIPGIPAVVMGRNEDFGWGLTTAYVDDQDVYIEKLDPQDADRYITPAGAQPFRTRDVLIAVKGEVSQSMTLRWTRHGPVIPDGFFGADQVTPQGHVAALAWTGLTEDDHSIESLIGLMRSHSIVQARPALALAVAPAQNVIMADRSGNVAMQVAGAAPLRRLTHQGQGRLPVPGWVAQNDWDGIEPFEDMPFVENPPGGIVVNTNNRTTNQPFPYHLNLDWGDSQRIARATRLLEQREFHSRESFVEIQTDIVSETARTLLPLMARNLWWAGDPAPDDTRGRFRKRALDRLAEWNGEMNQYAPEPLIYAAWVRALTRRLALDELGPLFDQVQGIEPIFIERVLRNVDGAGVWCDITKTEAVETCADITRLALDDALTELEETYGEEMDSWRWGDAHVALQKHPVLGDIFPFSMFVNIEQPTSGGDFTLMRGQMRNSGPTPYANVHGSGFRAVYDFSDPNGSVYIISTGESGHPFSRHYDDLSDLWGRGEYIRMTLDIDEARGGAIGTTRLVPDAAD
ncbi:penicillin acylase family protein [Paroceanicella profunda]|uniref:Penicillin acylase family protein n=1 Tax=Paroceanicella profunda TaxID=2579971 RepID=A0A5B8FZ53_9RHOB|nr:penicillin acylase family protein [Paroceanicella profunda]QDL92944.1 penicillin acylase family protein [Paroceanicella profunda]